jgi:hypothetical protein
MWERLVIAADCLRATPEDATLIIARMAKDLKIA